GGARVRVPSRRPRGAGAGGGQTPPPPPPPPVRTEPSQPAPDNAPLPQGAVARLGHGPFHQGATLDDIVFSRDGKLLASAGWDGRVCLWDAATGRELYRTPGRQGGNGLAFSADGRR